MKQEITNYILNNQIINDYFNKVDDTNKSDFKQHIYLIIFEMMNDDIKWLRMQDLYKRNELGKFIVGIINNQLKSNNSSFTKQYKSKTTIYKDIEEKADEQISSINTAILVFQIIKELQNIYCVDAVLYKLYRGIDPITDELKEPMTYQQIQKLIGINYQAVRSSVIKTEKHLKNIISYDSYL